ncbi:MAG: hypothetical protein AVDCRST_MAG93-6706, partial [uncultured Chloroflexia bacterium]
CPNEQANRSTSSRRCDLGLRSRYGQGRDRTGWQDPRNMYTRRSTAPAGTPPQRSSRRCWPCRCKPVQAPEPRCI